MKQQEELRNIKRDEIQKYIINNWEENKLIGTYQVSMGLGKGKIIADAIKLVVNTPEYYNKIVDCDVPILIQVSSTYLRDVDTVREILQWGVSKDLIASGKIEFVCYHTSYKWKKKDIGLMISDEVDFALTTEYGKVFNKQDPKYNLCLSGTFIDSKIELLNTLKYFPPIRFTYDVAQAQEESIINKNKIIVHYVPLDTKKNIKIEYIDKKTKEKKSFNTSEVEQYKYIEREIAILYSKLNGLYSELNNKKFLNEDTSTISNDIAKYTKQLQFKQASPTNKKSRANIVYRLNSLTKYAIELKNKLIEDEKNKVIIFCKFTDTIDEITNNGFHSKVDSATADNVVDRFNCGELKVIGVSKKANRGINFTGLNHCIAHSFTSSETDYFQGAKGRMTRLPIDETAYIHILVSYYTIKDKNGKETIKYCQNYTWAASFLEKEKSEIVSVNNIEDCLNIIQNDRAYEIN